MEKLTFNDVKELLKSRKYNEIRQLFELYPQIDIAEVCNEIELDEIGDLVTIFKVVKSEFTAEFFTYLDQDHQEALIKIMSDKQIASLIEESFNDDIADFLEDMPANVANRVLANSSKEDRAIINKLLNYKEDSAGSIMTTEFLEFRSDLTVEQAAAKIKEVGKNAETIYTIFVTDKRRNFLGTVELDDLIFADKSETLDNIITVENITVKTNTDQEQVAELVRRYNLNAIPVLNDDQKLVGIITVDDVVDVIQEEANEDISLQAGLTPLDDSYKNTSVFGMAKKYIPWILLLLVIDVFSSMVLSAFQGQIATVAVLSAFIPTIMDSGGNAGSQTSVVMVRALALNEFDKKDYFKVIWKELRTAFIVAVITAACSFAWFLLEMYLGLVTYPTKEYIAEFSLNGANIFGMRAGIAAIVSVTLLVTIIIAKLIGCVLPLIAKALKKDPALMSGPLTTSIVDVSSLLIYFGIFELITKGFNITLG